MQNDCSFLLGTISESKGNACLILPEMQSSCHLCEQSVKKKKNPIFSFLSPSPMVTVQGVSVVAHEQGVFL